MDSMYSFEAVLFKNNHHATSVALKKCSMNIVPFSIKVLSNVKGTFEGFDYSDSFL